MSSKLFGLALAMTMSVANAQAETDPCAAPPESKGAYGKAHGFQDFEWSLTASYFVEFHKHPASRVAQ